MLFIRHQSSVGETENASSSMIFLQTTYSLELQLYDCQYVKSLNLTKVNFNNFMIQEGSE